MGIRAAATSEAEVHGEGGTRRDRHVPRPVSGCMTLNFSENYRPTPFSRKSREVGQPAKRSGVAERGLLLPPARGPKSIFSHAGASRCIDSEIKIQYYTAGRMIDEAVKGTVLFALPASDKWSLETGNPARGNFLGMFVPAIPFYLSRSPGLVSHDLG